MAKNDYDKLIKEHYSKEATAKGLSSQSTMADEVTRDIETKVICSFIENSINCFKEKNSGKATILDIGCGNGYTLSYLCDLFPENNFVGIEKTDELRELAESRFKDKDNVKILPGDIRKADFFESNSVDILICQRVIINLLDKKDQAMALKNIVKVLVGGGKMLFIEAFQKALDTLNAAREEFDISLMTPAHHNLYLDDDFFDIDGLKPYSYENSSPKNFMSTHYFVTRVLHPMVTADKVFKRNSEFVQFFSEALKQNVGNYSPLNLYMLEKI